MLKIADKASSVSVIKKIKMYPTRAVILIRHFLLGKGVFSKQEIFQKFNDDKR